MIRRFLAGAQALLFGMLAATPLALAQDDADELAKQLSNPIASRSSRSRSATTGT